MAVRSPGRMPSRQRPADMVGPRAAAALRPRVVVGADDSYWGGIALRWAAEHAWLAGGELEVHAPAGDRTVTRGGVEVGRVLRDFPLLSVRSFFGGSAVDTLLAASRSADLLVLGCRGNDHRGLGIGTSVGPVVAGADCDVAVIGGRPAAVRGSHRSVSVLVGTRADRHALRSAARLAALRRVPLRILLAASLIGTDPVPPRNFDPRTALELAELAVREFEPAVVTHSVLARTTPHELVGKPGETDVLVLGIADRLDAVVRTALHHAPNPVLVAHALRSRSVDLGGECAHHAGDPSDAVEEGAAIDGGR